MRYGPLPGNLKFCLHSDTRTTKHMSAHDTGRIGQLLTMQEAQYSRNRVVHQSETNIAICELL